MCIAAAIVCASALAGEGSAAPSGISWPKNQALPVFAKARQLDVVDIERIPGEEQLLWASLQGLVNRKEPRIYLMRATEEGKETWLKTGLGVPYTVLGDPWELMGKYRSEVKGIIVYDPDVPDTINVATTLAGLKDAVVAAPDLLKRLTDAPHNLPVLEDLRGRFRNRLEAYSWQFANLWPKTTHRMLIGISPTRSVGVNPELRDEWKEILRENRPISNASNREVRELDLTPSLGGSAVYLRFRDSHPEDGWGAAVGEVVVRADGKEVARFTPPAESEKPFLYDSGGSGTSPGSGGHRFADNDRRFVYKIVPPEGTKRLIASVDIWNQFEVSAQGREPARTHVEVPNAYMRDYAIANRAMAFWLDPNVKEERVLMERIMSDVEPYTPYLGWFAQDVAGEFGGTELASRHGVYILAADWFENMSVFSAARASVEPPKAPPVPKLENKVYVTFVMSEGDNLQYNQHAMRRLWDDPARGRVPITWTTTPLLLEAAPGILGYYQRTATPNDVLIAGPSGAGYINPDPWPDATFGMFARQTRRYMLRTGMNTVHILNRIDGQNIPLSESKARFYAAIVLPKGLFMSWENRSRSMMLKEGVPLSVLREANSAAGIRRAIEEAVRDWDGKSPKFVSVGLLAWSVTPSHLASAVENLDPAVKIVRGDHYFDLMRKAHSPGPRKGRQE